MAGGVIEAASRGRGGGRRRRSVMSEINVTPFVDVMLVLLIVFMVSAPLLTVGVPINLPQSQAKSLSQNTDPLTVTIDDQGQIYLQDAKVTADELMQKLQSVTATRGGLAAPIYFKADKALNYGMIMRLLGRLNSAGYSRVELVTEFGQGS
jgi:biopolymer transport protein TolR